MKWIKTIDKLPEKHVQFFCRNSKGRKDIWNFGNGLPIPEWIEEYLDESSSSSSEEEAIGDFGFIHWIFDNHYSRYWGSDEPNKDKWYKSYTSPDRQYYTDIELYNLYKQSKK